MPVRYEIRVPGRLSDDFANSLGLAAEVRPVETILHGSVRDRVELYSVLERLDSLGLEVLEVRRTADG
jgi:hypothetical protein